MNNQVISIILLLITVLLFMYIFYTNNEQFYIPPSVVGAGDFHIQYPGDIADQGSFTDVMKSYIQGQGAI